MASAFREARTAKVASGLNFLLGLWVVTAPFLFPVFSKDAASLRNDIMSGGAVVMLAGIRMISPREAPVFSSVNLILGAWIMLSPWIYDYRENLPGSLNSIFVGVVILAVAGISFWATKQRAVS